jgi:O-antigen/teichoic acid export membrane protein
MDDIASEAIEDRPPSGFARKSAISFVGQVVAFVCNFGVGVLVARLLGAEGKGSYALIGSTVAIISSVVTMGMPSAATFFVGRHKWPPVGTLLLACGCALACMFVVLAALGIAGPQAVLRRAAFSPEVIRLTWLMLVVGVPLQIVSGVLGGVLRGRELIVETVWPGIVASVARACLVALVLLAVLRQVVGAVFADLASSALGAFLLVVLLCSALRRWPSPAGKPSLRRLVFYGLQLQAGSVLFGLWLRGDLYFVNYFVGQKAVGQYSVAMAFAELASFPATAVTSVLFARLSLSGADERPEWTLRTHRAVALLSVCTGIVLGAVAFLIPAIYGHSFRPSVEPTLICLGGCVLWSEIRVLYMFMMAEDRPWGRTALCSVGVACMLSLDLLLIPLLGIRGAALAYAASLLVTYAAALGLVARMGLVTRARALVPGTRDVAELLAALRSAVSRRA